MEIHEREENKKTRRSVLYVEEEESDEVTEVVTPCHGTLYRSYD